MYGMPKTGRNLASVLPLFLLVIFGYPNSAISDYIKFDGSLNCTVKHNELATISDGKPKIYASVEDEFDVGDNLIFTYEYYHLDNGYRSLMYSLKDANRDQFLVVGFVNNKDRGHLDITDYGTLRGWKIEELLSWPDLTEINLSDDRFFLQANSQRLRLQRYYKGDYQGIFVTRAMTRTMNSQTVLLDCRTIKDAVDDILKDFKE